MNTAIETETTSANYDRLTRSSYTHSMAENWRRIHFTKTGHARLAHTIGLLEGIALNDPESAHRLADSLVKYLDYLSNYAGTMDSPEGNLDHTGTPLQFPAYRVVLSDDGGIGSFSIGWYRAVPHKSMMKVAETIAESLSMERHQKHHDDLNADDSRPIWEEALERSKQKLKLRKELDDSRCYRPEWDKDKTFGFMYEFVSYGYSHNGGLIFHYGDDIRQGSWSTHT